MASPDHSGKKRTRTPAPEENDSDKKLKAEDKALNGGTNGGTASNGGGTSIMIPYATTTTKPPSPPPEAFLSPVAAKKGAERPLDVEEEDTPYMTARQGKEESRERNENTQKTPTKLAPTLESIQEETAISKTATATKTENVKIVRQGSWLCTTFLLFMWIASSAVLGGLWLKEKLEHDMDLFRLQQDLLDQPPAESVQENTELEKLVKQLKIQAAQAEGALSGYKRQFQETLAKLEHHKTH